MSYQIRAAATQRAALRQLAAIDRALGLPRQHTEDEIARTGPAAQRVPLENIRTETHAIALQHADGRVAIPLDDTIRALVGRAIDVEDGATVRITITATQTHGALPGAPDEWTPLPPRGGLAGRIEAARGARE